MRRFRKEFGLKKARILRERLIPVSQGLKIGINRQPHSQVSSRNLKNLFLCAKRAAAKQITPLCSSPDRLSKAFTLCITIQRRSFFSSYPLIISAHRFNRPVGCRACLDARLLRAGVDNTSSAQINRHMAAVVNNITGLGLGIAHLTARTSLLI